MSDKRERTLVYVVFASVIALFIAFAVVLVVHYQQTYDKVSTACLELDPNATILQLRGAILCVLSDGRVVTGLDK